MGGRAEFLGIDICESVVLHIIMMTMRMVITRPDIECNGW